MVLVYIKPARIGYEQHMFEGISCEHADSMIVENKISVLGTYDT